MDEYERKWTGKPIDEPITDQEREEMEKQKGYMVNKIRRWYESNKQVKYEIFFACMQKREMVLMTPKFLKPFSRFDTVRCLSNVNHDGIIFNLKNSGCYKENNPVNMYYSLATYIKGLPRFNNVYRFRTEEVTKWKDEHHKQMIAYDMLIDIDSPDTTHMDVAKQDCYKIMCLFDEYKIKYSVRFSGMGYHIIVPHECFAHLNKHFNPHEDIENSIYTLYNDITQWLHNTISEFVDTNLHDSRRITKAPYSLGFYPIGTFVCWLFETKDEFIQHNYMDYKTDTACDFKGHKSLYHRSTRCFFSVNWKTEGVDKLVKEVIRHGKKKKDPGR